MSGQGYLARPGASSLAEVVDLILSKGLVIDAYARVSLLGIEIMTLDARIAMASVDTYLRYAEAVERLDPDVRGTNPIDLEEDATEAFAEGAVDGVIHGATQAIGEIADELKPSSS